MEFGLEAEVVVATDDPRIDETVSHSNVRAVRTNTKHKSGTERVAEVVQLTEFSNFETSLNIQGDQLFLPKSAATGALQMLREGFRLGTAAAPLLAAHEKDPNRVKVVVAEDGKALLFSRNMPVLNDNEAHTRRVLLHLGVYSYTRDALLEWVSLHATDAEFEQGLEQLRPFHHGIPLGVSDINERAEPGIDVPEDLINAKKILAPTRTSA
jgi:3-deoxy-manno-octulosonate cytidylyltransferase (CMP-KDO synthetase)